MAPDGRRGLVIVSSRRGSPADRAARARSAENEETPKLWHERLVSAAVAELCVEPQREPIAAGILVELVVNRSPEAPGLAAEPGRAENASAPMSAPPTANASVVDPTAIMRRLLCRGPAPPGPSAGAAVA
ncbi:MAG: hypothetical protein ACYCSF_05050 [Acidimicrobiales bacterium]